MISVFKFHIKEIPCDIDQFINVTEIYINNTGITSLPDELFSMYYLKILSLSSNKIKWLSPKISNLVNLNSLHIYDNSLRILPKEILILDKISQFTFDYNLYPNTLDIGTAHDRLNYLLQNGYIL